MRWGRPPMHEVAITLPAWVAHRVDYLNPYDSDESRMRLAILLARENAERGTGGPFGAALFERESGILVAVGVDSVTRLNNSTLHAEMVALQLAQRRIVSHSLRRDGHPTHELFTSCDPCPMCLGATRASGVDRLVCAAEREDADPAAVDEGPMITESYAHLERTGVEIVRGFLRDEARAVLNGYTDGRR